ncbi:MAG: hypothetical protein AAGP08_04235 [Pseudomonadota bacterium]
MTNAPAPLWRRISPSITRAELGAATQITEIAQETMRMMPSFEATGPLLLAYPDTTTPARPGMLAPL